MPEALGSPPSPRSVLFWNGAAWQWALVDAAGHLQIDVVASGLPAGAATAAHQVTQNTALQLIDDLRNALQSVAADRLIVRGEDQHFSIKGVLAVTTSSAISGAGGYIASPSVPAGEYWIVTTIVAVDITTATTRIYMGNFHNGVGYRIWSETAAVGADEAVKWCGHTYLDVGDTIQVYFTGGLAGDSCVIWLTGYRMTVET